MVDKKLPIFLGLKNEFPDFATPFKGFGHDIVIVNESGGLFWAENTCSHMGTRFCSEKIKDHQSISCPYHGRPIGEFEPLDVWENFVFLKSDKSVSWVKGPIERVIMESLRFIDEDIGECFQTEFTTGKFPFYLWMQNTMDPGHLKTVHSDFSSVIAPRPQTVLFEEGGVLSSYILPVKKAAEDSFSSRVKNNSFPYFRHISVAPNLSVSSFMNIIYSIESVIQDGEWSFVTTRYFTPKNVDVPAHILKASIAGHKKILDEDRAICEKVAKTYHPPLVFDPGEERIQHYLEAVGII